MMILSIFKKKLKIIFFLWTKMSTHRLIGKRVAFVPGFPRRSSFDDLFARRHLLTRNAKLRFIINFEDKITLGNLQICP